jgi:hypothetical protein
MRYDMRSTIAALAAIFALAFAVSGYSQSLVELAKKEKARRAKAQQMAKTITNKDTSKYKGGALTVTSSHQDSRGKASDPKGGEGNTVVKETDGEDEPADFFGRTESFWRQTFADARKLVADLEAESNVIRLRIAELQTKFYNEDNGFKQQDIQREIQKTIYEQDINKEALARAKADLAQLELEAKKSGALPGWIRAETP